MVPALTSVIILYVLPIILFTTPSQSHPGSELTSQNVQSSLLSMPSSEGSAIRGTPHPFAIRGNPKPQINGMRHRVVTIKRRPQRLRSNASSIPSAAPKVSPAAPAVSSATTMDFSNTPPLVATQLSSNSVVSSVISVPTSEVQGRILSSKVGHMNKSAINFQATPMPGSTIPPVPSTFDSGQPVTPYTAGHNSVPRTSSLPILMQNPNPPTSSQLYESDSHITDSEDGSIVPGTSQPIPSAKQFITAATQPTSETTQHTPVPQHTPVLQHTGTAPRGVPSAVLNIAKDDKNTLQQLMAMSGQPAKDPKGHVMFYYHHKRHYVPKENLVL